MAKVYESEHTQFMRTWLQQHPEQTTEKLRGRRLWWDQAPQSLDEMNHLSASALAQPAYVYYAQDQD